MCHFLKRCLKPTRDVVFYVDNRNRKQKGMNKNVEYTCQVI
jgi:hypothetical protein